MKSKLCRLLHESHPTISRFHLGADVCPSRVTRVLVKASLLTRYQYYNYTSIYKNMKRIIAIYAFDSMIMKV